MTIYIVTVNTGRAGRHSKVFTNLPRAQQHIERNTMAGNVCTLLEVHSISFDGEASFGPVIVP